MKYGFILIGLDFGFGRLFSSFLRNCNHECVNYAEKLESLAKLPLNGCLLKGITGRKNGNVDEYTSAVRLLGGGTIP